MVSPLPCPKSSQAPQPVRVIRVGAGPAAVGCATGSHRDTERWGGRVSTIGAPSVGAQGTQCTPDCAAHDAALEKEHLALNACELEAVAAGGSGQWASSVEGSGNGVVRPSAAAGPASGSQEGCSSSGGGFSGSSGSGSGSSSGSSGVDGAPPLPWAVVGGNARPADVAAVLSAGWLLLGSSSSQEFPCQRPTQAHGAQSTSGDGTECKPGNEGSVSGSAGIGSGGGPGSAGSAATCTQSNLSHILQACTISATDLIHMAERYGLVKPTPDGLRAMIYRFDVFGQYFKVGSAPC